MRLLFIITPRVGDAVLWTGRSSRLIVAYPGLRATVAAGAPLSAPGDDRCATDAPMDGLTVEMAEYPARALGQRVRDARV